MKFISEEIVRMVKMDTLLNEVIIRQFKEGDYEAVSNILANSFKSKFHSLTSLSEEMIIELLKDSGFAGNKPFEG